MLVICVGLLLVFVLVALALPQGFGQATGLGPLAARSTPKPRKTEVTIQGEGFLINGKPTYQGREWNRKKIEGLLLNARMVQGIFDDLNINTKSQWAYPDTKKWDPERNTNEFVAAMPAWRAHGLLAVTLNLQGGNPRGYAQQQPWHNSAFQEDGRLRLEYFDRLERILDKADELGMTVILGLFYFGQDERFRDENAIALATDMTLDWLFAKNYRNVLIEVANECDNRKYEFAVLLSDRIHELMKKIKARTHQGRRLLVSASYCGGRLPRPNVMQEADFLLLHGNGVGEVNRIMDMVKQSRRILGYRPMPVLFNEDDHFDFERPINNMVTAIGQYASWGYFDPGQGNYVDGYQSPPVNWTINTVRKKAFFAKVKEVTGA